MKENKSIEASSIAEPLYFTLFIIYTLSLTNLVYKTWEGPLITKLGPLILITLFVLRRKLSLKIGVNGFIKVSYLSEVTLLLYMFKVTLIPEFGILFTIMAADGILFIDTYLSLFFIYCGYFAYAVIDPETGINTLSERIRILFDALNYSILLMAIVLGKNQIIQRLKLEKMTQVLKHQAKEIEELAVFEERNRISGDMHDTVGHTLSLALIELEASKALFKRDPETAFDKILSAREQVGLSLEEIRRTVKALNNTAYQKDLTQTIEEICLNSSKVGDLKIERQITIESEIHSLQKKVIVLAVKESLTNVIKHSESHLVDLQVVENKGVLKFSCSSDNGKNQSLVKGFGLQNMEDKFVGLGGVFEAKIIDNKFVVQGAIPIQVTEAAHD